MKLIVVPEELRDPIKTLCHEGTSAHLGITKSKDKLNRYFYWPNCYRDMERFVKFCDQCQRAGKPNDKKKAPLKLVPVIQEGFTKLNIDACGPLPITSKGNRYLITAICMSLKFPEAIPVSDISSVSVTDALLNIFSRMGFTREIQCDQDAGSEWDKHLPSILLVLRTVSHESTGYTPSELVYGKNLRTPETLVMEHWMEPEEEGDLVTEYMFKLINRLKRCQEVAMNKMEEMQVKRKTCKLMAELLNGLEERTTYLDDIAIFSDTWESLLKHVETVLQRIKIAKLIIKPSKCKFAQQKVKFLGHIVSQGFCTPSEVKDQDVLEFPTPRTKTRIRAFLDLAGYYEKHKSVLGNRCSVDGCVDGKSKGMGAVLTQLTEQGEEHPILYLSKKFSEVEKRYCTTEKECASIVFAIKRLHYYLDGNSFLVMTDHNPLVWLNINVSSNPRLMRWALALQPYNFRIVHRSGKSHKNADSLSRSVIDN
ncbi:retrovirus-related Pol polyprotein from transposon 297 [Trichonephila clavipes]|nr:retrovirus-related Pol polyprotein from transposon 297 [Trichonephila clavipes]